MILTQQKAKFRVQNKRPVCLLTAGERSSAMPCISCSSIDWSLDASPDHMDLHIRKKIRTRNLHPYHTCTRVALTNEELDDTLLEPSRASRTPIACLRTSLGVSPMFDRCNVKKPRGDALFMYPCLRNWRVLTPKPVTSISSSANELRHIQHCLHSKWT